MKKNITLILFALFLAFNGGSALAFQGATTGKCADCHNLSKEEAAKLLKADVYKAGHHGSRTSSTQEFLDQIKPSITVVSAGKDNRWGHPHPETLEKLRTMNARVLRTDELGNIALYSDPAQGCCQECRESLSRDPRGVGPSGIACASYGSQLSLLCRGQFEAAPKTAAECLAS